jgi:predicted RecA/RadA family phage recombinase
MKNYRGTGDRVIVVAGGTRVSGTPYVEQNIAGIAETDAASGARYALKTEGEFELDFVTSTVKGDLIHINATTFALTRTAYGTAGGSGTRPFAIATAVPGDGITADATKEPKTGKMWVKLLNPAQANVA